MHSRPSGCNFLTWPTARTLARHHSALHEELGSPDSPGLPTLQSCCQACITDWAVRAHGLGHLHVVRRIGEEKLRVDLQTRNLQLPSQCLGKHLFERAGEHLRHPQVTSSERVARACARVVRWCEMRCCWKCGVGATKKPRIPVRVPRLEGAGLRLAQSGTPLRAVPSTPRSASLAAFASPNVRTRFAATSSAGDVSIDACVRFTS
jgi:hypothetical protein